MDSQETSQESEVIEIRKDKIIDFIKKRYTLLSYVILGFIVWLSVYIRTRNLSDLRDITTGGWTLGPDLDPFLFLRWAEYIVAHGKLMIVDMMRYVPLGAQTGNEVLLHPYLIAWFHKLAINFGSTSVTQSAALYPVFMFALTVIAFFFLAREIFIKKLGKLYSNVVALLSSLFLVILPPLLPRTIAGIPEKEASGFLFLFLALFFFLKSWRSDKRLNESFFSLLAGISTALMAFVWGGYFYIYLTISISILIAFFLSQINKNRLFSISVFLLSSFIIIGSLSERYSFTNLFNSTTTLIPISVFVILIVHFLLFELKILSKFRFNEKFNEDHKIPPQVVSIIITLIIGALLGSIYFGPQFLYDKGKDIISPLFNPVTDRVGITVAENRQPYFDEWASNFGPEDLGFLKNMLKVNWSILDKSIPPLIFWLFFAGSIYLYMLLTNVFNQKERRVLVSAYTIFLFAIIFSRYKADSTLNGTNFTSMALYVLGVVILVCSFGYYLYKHYKEKNYEIMRSIDFGLIMLFAFFFLSIISARGSVRTIMVLVPPASIIVSYFMVGLVKDSMNKERTKTNRNIIWTLTSIVIILALLAGSYQFLVSTGTAAGYVPSPYTQQWQKAMSWTRENTPKNAVFGHWWDYGYWVQTIGERATVLDGGNSYGYWDYLMGRHGLTSKNETETLEFLYSHNTTHFLIDSTDIGKYPAFASIGSNEKGDRYSYIPTLLKDNSQASEKKNSTVFFYSASIGLDEDISYTDKNGSTINFYKEKTGLGGITLEIDPKGSLTNQPRGVLVTNGAPYQIPLRYAYYNNQLIDFGSGIEAGVFVFPAVADDGSSIDKSGAMLYLSRRVVNNQFSKLYLFKQNSSFELVHSEDDFVVTQVRAMSKDEELGDFVYYRGLRGPIRIWKINYPADMKVNPEYLQTDYPNKALALAIT